MIVPHLEPALVLVVDDDMMLRYLAREALELEGFRVQEAADGATALDHIAQERPSMVLLDVHMPVMDGFALCTKLRETPTWALLPVMMMTASTDVAAINRAYEVGATDFVTKPVNWTILTQRLRYTLRASQALERARLSEAKLASAQRMAGLGHWDLDLQTDTATLSEEAYRILGLHAHRTEAEMEAFWKVVHPDDREAVKQRRHDAIHAYTPYRLDYRLTPPDGGERAVHEQADILYDHRGQPERILGTIQDITERKRAEAALQAGKEAAEHATHIKSTFMANISHELRTPINGALGYLQLLEEITLGESEELREYIGKALGSAEHLLTIVEHLLDFSSIENPSPPPLNSLDFELRTALDDVLAPFIEKAQHKGLAFTSLVHASVPTWVAGDPGRLRQVLTHVVDNAIKFTDAGEVELRVRLLKRTAHEAVIHFDIQDTGIGIPQEVQAGLFQPFFQADGSATRKYGGTGLGLTIAHGLVERLGGEIGVESEPDTGSTFWFTVCFSTCLAPPQPYTENALVMKRKSVLCVDGHAASRSTLKAQLEAWGMIVSEAGNGAQAMSALDTAIGEDRPYDLALLAHRLPELDGMFLARRIRRDPALASTRLVLLSGVGQRGHGEAAQRVGLSAYLVQPVQPSQLYACLSMVLSPLADPTALVTRHRVTEARTHLLTWVLVASTGERQKTATRIFQTLGCRVDVVSDHTALIEALRHRFYAYLLLDGDALEIDTVAAAVEIRASQPETERPLPIIAVGSQTEDAARWREARMDAVMNAPLQVEAILNVLKRLQPALPSGMGLESQKPSESGVMGSGSMRDTLQAEYGPELATELCQLFLAETPGVIAMLRQAWDKQDVLAWQQALLRLQSSCHSLGATSLERLCLGGAQMIASQGGSGGGGGGETFVEQVEMAFRKLQHQLS